MVQRNGDVHRENRKSRPAAEMLKEHQDHVRSEILSEYFGTKCIVPWFCIYLGGVHFINA
jgi:hypothetical protein